MTNLLNGWKGTTVTRYNDSTWDLEGTTRGAFRDEGIVSYREGVDRVLGYVESIHAYPKLVKELKWAIEEGII